MAHQANGHNYQFYGVGKKKAKRRSNSPKGSKADRKYYAYVRKDQRGTPMETMINSNYDELDGQFNAMRNHPNGLRMATNEATGRLARVWNRAGGRTTKGRAVGNYIDKHGGTMRQAMSALKDIAGSVSFGADPKSP